MRESEDMIATVRSLAGEIRSRVSEGDMEGRFPYEEMELLKRHGLLGLAVPIEFGGLGGKTRMVNEACRELAKANGSVAQIFFVHSVATQIIAQIGNGEQRDRFFAEVVKRGARIGNASSEPGATVQDWSSKLAPASGGFLLNGVKHFCTGHEGAEFILVAAIVEGALSLGEGVLMCLVPRGAEGVTLHNDWNVMGQRQTASGTVTFRGVFVPEKNALGRPGELLKKSPSLFGPYFQSSLAAIYVGIAEGAYEAALEYVRTETRPWPSAGVDAAVKDPYVQQHVGEMRVRIEGAKLLVERASLVIENAAEGRATRAEASIASAHAKVASTEVALEVTSRIFQVCGARATYRKFGFDRYWRDARTLTLHDPVDRKLQEIGLYDLMGKEPPVGFYT
jgi:alkylation response protein AidB-like acyl-CoA dehydrogenase